MATPVMKSAMMAMMATRMTTTAAAPAKAIRKATMTKRRFPQDWEIRASRPLPITDTRTATAGFPAAFLGPEFDSGNRASEPRQVATQVSLAS